MRTRAAVLLFAWWFLAWGLHDNHYGVINQVGPFDTEADCEFYRSRTEFPRTDPKWTDRRVNATSPSCWFTKEQVIDVPKESPRAR